MTLLITALADRRAIDCASSITPEQLMATSCADQVVLVEPTFLSFRAAGNNELGFPFLASAHAKDAKRLHLFLTYTLENARQYKGYVLDLVEHVKAQGFAYTDCTTVPFVSCGTPMADTTLCLTACAEPWALPAATMPMMPSVYFPGLLAHVMRNRPNYPINVSSRFIGASRSDLNLLPPVSQWGGRSLMVEYRKGVTTEITRMSPEHVGQLFGVKPCQYTDELAMVLPAGVVQAFA